MICYNMGCGTNKISDCINVDIEPSCKPDQIMNFLQPLPIDSDTVDRVYFFHVIEHIPASWHKQVLGEFRRILKPDGRLIISYPEFSKCALNYINNYKGIKAFWKATLYGRQLYPSDYHLALMDSVEFVELLKEVGLNVIECKPEGMSNYNTVVKCGKGTPMPLYEDILREEIFGKQE